MGGLAGWICVAGGDVQKAGKYALVGLLMCVTFGAVITKLGVRNAWTWGRMEAADVKRS